MRSTHGVTFSSEDQSTEAGSVTVPLLLLTVILGGAAFSALGYGMLWQSKMKLQLRLDRCVESAAKELTEIQDGIEQSNLRMNLERAAAVAAAVPSFGESLNAVKPVLAAEVMIQETIRTRWIIRQAKWIANRGCDGRSDLFLPLPGLKWSRLPPDAIGDQPLRWNGGTRMTIHLWKTNRFSQAEVRDGKKQKWEAAWIPRTSFGG